MRGLQVLQKFLWWKKEKAHLRKPEIRKAYINNNFKRFSLWCLGTFLHLSDINFVISKYLFTFVKRKIMNEESNLAKAALIEALLKVLTRCYTTFADDELGIIASKKLHKVIESID